jgi:ribosomal protein S18 acetylase RimI-like enzyme
MSTIRVRGAGGRLRVASWRGDSSSVLLAPILERGGPRPADVARCVGVLRDRGVQTALTAALGPADQQPFLDHGFEVHERLHLLTHDLRLLPAASDRVAAAAIRRARRRDRAGVLGVDRDAFPPFWQLDDEGLTEAVAATPSTRFRVAHDVVGADGVIAYTIWGRAGHRGYLQRLAVAPKHEGRGIAVALLADGLRWLRRRGATRVYVNTQEANDRALRLYERTGFRRQRDGLAVLRLELR